MANLFFNCIPLWIKIRAQSSLTGRILERHLLCQDLYSGPLSPQSVTLPTELPSLGVEIFTYLPTELTNLGVESTAYVSLLVVKLTFLEMYSKHQSPTKQRSFPYVVGGPHNLQRRFNPPSYPQLIHIFTTQTYPFQLFGEKRLTKHCCLSIWLCKVKWCFAVKILAQNIVFESGKYWILQGNFL